MRPSRWVPARCTRLSGSAAFSVPKRAALATIISVSPMMALSGVRSSWLMLARNCDLCWLASSSWRLLSWISSNSRTFSIAIAAWSAKVATSSICRSVNGSHLRARSDADDADRNSFAQHRHSEDACESRIFPAPPANVYSEVVQHVGDMHDRAFEQGPALRCSAFRLDGNILDILDEIPAEISVAIRATELRSLLPRDRGLVSARTAGPPNSTSVCSTVCRSKVERLMTLRTSAVAVCCCSDFAQLVACAPHLLEQPHVLDRDHGLVGEGARPARSACR